MIQNNIGHARSEKCKHNAEYSSTPLEIKVNILLIFKTEKKEFVLPGGALVPSEASHWLPQVP